MRKHILAALSGVVAFVLLVVLSFAFMNPAHAGEVTCTITSLGNSPNLTVTCVDENGEPVSPSDIDIQEIVGNTVTVVVTDTITDTITKTIKIPGPTITKVPDPIVRTEKIIVPGPTKTIYTQAEAPAPQVVTRTVEVPGPTETTTVTASPTPTASPTGQPTPESDTMEPDTGPAIDFGDGDTTPAEVGIGILTLLALVGLILLALYAGYILGYKDKERTDTNFMRALLDSVKSR